MKKATTIVLAVSVMLGTIASVSPSLAAEKQGTTVVKSDYATHPLKNSIDYVLKNRLMSTFPDGSFRPEQGISQAELVTGLVTIKGLKKSSPVPEVAAGHWAKAAYEKAKADGMLDGVAIKPYAILTREEAAVLVINAMQSVRNSRGMKSEEPYKNAPNIQFVVAYGWIPKKAGKFPNGVSTTVYDGMSSFSRAEQAKVLHTLVEDINVIREANKFADEFHSSLKTQSGYLVGHIPQATNHLVISVAILYKDNTSKLLNSKSKLKEDLSKVQSVFFMVETLFRKGLVEYKYEKFNPPIRERRWF